MLVSHVASGPHLFDHQVPQLGLCFQIGLENLLPALNTQLQTGDSQEQERSRGHFYFLKELKPKIYINTQQHISHLMHRKMVLLFHVTSSQLLTSCLYLQISVLRHLHVSRSPVGQKEEPSLSHGDLSHTTARLDRGGEFKDVLAGLNVFRHRRRQAHLEIHLYESAAFIFH